MLSVINVYNCFRYKILCFNNLSLSILILFLCISELCRVNAEIHTRRSTGPRGRYRWWATIYKQFRHTSTPAGQQVCRLHNSTKPWSTTLNQQFRDRHTAENHHLWKYKSCHWESVSRWQRRDQCDLFCELCLQGWFSFFVLLFLGVILWCCWCVIGIELYVC